MQNRRKMIMALPLIDASLLNKFRIYVRIKLKSDMIPPRPSFHIASTRPARAIAQMVKIINISGVNEDSTDPAYLF
jgi:hypothetical protein